MNNQPLAFNLPALRYCPWRILLLLALLLGGSSRLAHGQSGDILRKVWVSAEDEFNTSAAWGDYDQDGDLDLAVGGLEGVRLYRNDGVQPASATPILTSVWQSPVALQYATNDVVWGDFDGDGDLDLAAASQLYDFNVGYTHLYRNNGLSSAGTPQFDLAWQVDEIANTSSVAWGDVDQDGDLDLVVGNDGSPSRLYRNDTTQQGNAPAAFTPIWASPAANPDHTSALAWGDVDGDEDLDLVTGNGQLVLNGGEPLRLYLNQNGNLAADPVWSSAVNDITFDLAWGDYDGDGDLDLATGAVNINAFDSPIGAPNRIYRNVNGVLSATPVWTSPESEITLDVEWADLDGDGDLDLLAGNDGLDRLYRNDGLESDQVTPKLTSAWLGKDEDATTGLAVGDFNSDGVLDLAAANGTTGGQTNHLYRNDLLLLAGEQTFNTDLSGRAVGAAWGDYDGDGDRDVVICYGRSAVAVRLFSNDNGIIASTSVWSIPEAIFVSSAAWGDVDGDHDLDLVIGLIGAPNRLYRNDNGMLTQSPVWSSAETDATFAVVWGDYDGDGDLDLAVANGSVATDAGTEYHPNRLYRNDNGQLTTAAVWTGPGAEFSAAVAWGDYDKDGDLDLLFGNGTTTQSIKAADRLYRNDGVDPATQTPIFTAVWQQAEAYYDSTSDVGWVDYDGDGDLDAVTANHENPNRIYRNQAGQLDTTPAWESLQKDGTQTMAWGDFDGDGDFDLATGNGGVNFAGNAVGRKNYVYRNENGALSPDPIIEALSDISSTTDIAWVDIQNNGKPALVAINDQSASRVYTNLRWRAPAGQNHPPRVTVQRPGATPDADFYATAEILTAGQIEIHYTLFDAEGDPVAKIIPEFSATGGGQWQPATPAPGSDGLTNLTTSAQGTPHRFIWQAAVDIIKSDNVRFRIRAMPSAKSSPLAWSAAAGISPPFRVAAPWYIRVVNENGNPVAGATVYANGQPITQTLTGLTRTDQAGLLAPLTPPVGATLVALALQQEAPSPRAEHNGWAYRTYLTSHTWTAAGQPLADTATSLGEQRLVVKKAQPLILFNLLVALEWNADDAYLNQLADALRSGSNYLYDLTDGQMAFGEVTIYEDGEQWTNADLQFLARSDVHPYADIGGILAADTSRVIHVGRGWDRYGDNTQPWNASDGLRTLVHEFGHYGLYLWDEYLFYDFDANGNLLGLSKETGCTSAAIRAQEDLNGTNASAMDWQYATSELSARTPTALWGNNCEITLQTQHNPQFQPQGHGESTWETLARHYADSANPPRWQIVTPMMRGSVLTGPVALAPGLPAWPQVHIHPVAAQSQPLILTVKEADGTLYTKGAVVTLYQGTVNGTRPLNQGFTDKNGHLAIFGAGIGDKVRAATLNGGLQGELTIHDAGGALVLTLNAPGAARIALANPYPTLRIIPAYTQDPNQIDLTFVVQQFDPQSPPSVNAIAPSQNQSVAVQLSPTSGGHVGALSVNANRFGIGFVQVAGTVNGQLTYLDATYQLQAVVPNTPARLFAADGNLNFYLAPNTKSATSTLVVINRLGVMPGAPPPDAQIIGDVYELTASGSRLNLEQTGLLSLHYAADLTADQQTALHIYRWDPNKFEWKLQESTVDHERREVTTVTNQLGIYTLMVTDREPPAELRIYLPFVGQK
ncbi:MAG: VCBS repeat-containing protein [Caldilineaceae bacterium]